MLFLIVKSRSVRKLNALDYFIALALSRLAFRLGLGLDSCVTLSRLELLFDSLDSDLIVLLASVSAACAVETHC